VPVASIAATARAGSYVVGSFVVAIVVAIVLPLGIGLGVGLAPVLVGVPIAMATVALWRGMAAAERQRAALVLGAPIAAVVLPGPPGERLWDRFRRRLADPAVWKELAWLLLLVPLGTVAASVAVAAWAAAATLLAIPAVAPAAPDGSLLGELSTALRVLAPVGGVVLVVLAAAITQAAAAGLAVLARALLAPDERRVLEQRVAALTETRAGAVESADQTLRRIERDLHDGAQHRLAYVALELGRARQKLDSDPAAAGPLVDRALEESRRALGELRDLVRGVHPSVLEDRGLDAALSGLAARSAVPVRTRVELPARPPRAQETAAYFVVAEALTNAARHAGATRVDVEVRQRDGRLAVRVADDGRGGAAPAPGGGLAGLAQRVEALDGTLTVTSPPGGGTTLEAVL
jgi:signal transduction histidine kinase